MHEIELICLDAIQPNPRNAPTHPGTPHIPTRFGSPEGGPYFAPVFPTFFFSTSPV